MESNKVTYDMEADHSKLKFLKLHFLVSLYTIFIYLLLVAMILSFLHPVKVKLKVVHPNQL